MEKRLESLSPAKRELLVRKLQAQRSAPAAAVDPAPLLIPAARTAPPPLSFAQQRLWFLDQLEGPNATYNMRSALQLRGPLDRAVLQRSLNAIVRRHEVLRTVFAWRGEQPVQIIAPPAAVPLTAIDLTASTPAERAATLARILHEEPRRPFDLGRGPLFRLILILLEPQDHVLLSIIHHSICDGGSLGLFVRELGTLYRAFRRGEPAALPELPVQYADFAVWQRRWLSGDTLATQLAYWKSQLAGAPPVLALPTDRLRPPVQRFAGAGERCDVAPALTQRLYALARTAQVSPFMLLLAAFAVLLARYSGQDDLVIGSPVAGRDRRELESLIGFFVNTLALRVDLAGRPRFTDLLGRVRRLALAAYSHQDLPFEKLVEELQPAA